MTKNNRLNLCAIVILACGSTARGLIISGDADNNPAPIAAHSTAPAADPGWNRVTYYDSGTATYLGNGWAATINHVGGGSQTLNFGGTTYTPDQVANIGASVSGGGIRLLHINVQPGEFLYDLPPISLAASEPAANEAGRFIGTGKIQTSTTFYTRTIGGYDYTGYQFGGSRGKRWGDAPVFEAVYTEFDTNGNVVAIHPDYITTSFLPVEGAAMGVLNDSGSPFFRIENGQWVLSGINYASYYYDSGIGYPYDRFAPFQWRSTIIVDVSVYREQIFAITGLSDTVIPEPSSAFLFAMAMACLLRRKRFGV